MTASTGPASEGPRVVVDASAVLAWVLREPGAEVVDKVLPHAVLPSANLAEVLFRAKDSGHAMTSEELRDSLLGMGLTIEPVQPEDALRAGELLLTSKRAAQRADKGPDKRRLSLGDALCIAAAERMELPLTGGDRHWASVQLKVSFSPFR